MPESPLTTLSRWEDAGAGWRLDRYSGGAAIVELLACTGEPVDALRSDDPALLVYLRDRPRSDLEPTRASRPSASPGRVGHRDPARGAGPCTGPHE